jgi:hypothetical protein
VCNIYCIQKTIVAYLLEQVVYVVLKKQKDVDHKHTITKLAGAYTTPHSIYCAVVTVTIKLARCKFVLLGFFICCRRYSFRGKV